MTTKNRLIDHDRIQMLMKLK